MATDESPPIIELIDSVADKEQTHDDRQEDSHMDISYNTFYSKESLKHSSIAQVCRKVRSKFMNHRCCLWSSKAVILILVWNLIISVGFKSFFDPSLYTVTMFKSPYRDGETTDFVTLILFGLSYGISALLLVFYPLAGFLADVCWGRYATVKNSLCFLFWSIAMIIVLTGLALLGSTPMIMRVDDYNYDSIHTIEIVTVAVLSIIFGIPVLLGIILLLCSTIAFNANVIQFGIDQLHDAPAEYSLLYIHWYVWTSQVGLFLIRLPSANVFSYGIKAFVYAGSPGLILLTILLLGVTLCLEKYKRH